MSMLMISWWPAKTLNNTSNTSVWFLNTSNNMGSSSICKFGVPSLDFLCHLVDSSGIHPLPDKVQAVTDFPQPTSRRQLRAFVGLVNFYHRFIPGCARILQPLNTAHTSGTNLCHGMTRPLLPSWGTLQNLDCGLWTGLWTGPWTGLFSMNWACFAA